MAHYVKSFISHNNFKQLSTCVWQLSKWSSLCLHTPKVLFLYCALQLSIYLFICLLPASPQMAASLLRHMVPERACLTITVWIEKVGERAEGGWEVTLTLQLQNGFQWPKSSEFSLSFSYLNFVRASLSPLSVSLWSLISHQYHFATFFHFTCYWPSIPPLYTHQLYVSSLLPPQPPCLLISLFLLLFQFSSLSILP